MKAVVVTREHSRPELAEVPDPEPEPGEALLRTLRVGIDSTDHEVIEGNHGGYPAGDDYQILGHEAVAVVEDANGTGLEEGSLVVPTVRRPRGDDDGGYFERGEPDMAPDGEYVERGIVGAHGYMSEYFSSPPEYLVPVPSERVVLFGFSQGAGIVSEYAARNPRRYGGLIALSGSLLGPETSHAYDGTIDGTPVFVGCGSNDPYVPAERIHETASVFEQLDGDVTVELYEELGHAITDDEIQVVNTFVEQCD